MSDKDTMKEALHSGTREEIVKCIYIYAGEEFLIDDVWDLAKKNMSELKKVLRNIYYS